MTEIGKPLENPDRDVQPVYDPVPREAPPEEVPVPVTAPDRDRELVPAGPGDRG